MPLEVLFLSFFFLLVFFVFQKKQNEKQIQTLIPHWFQTKDIHSQVFNVTLYSDAIKPNLWNQYFFITDLSRLMIYFYTAP